MKQPERRRQKGKEAEGGRKISECSCEKAARTAKLHKAECRSRRQAAAVSSSQNAGCNRERIYEGRSKQPDSRRQKAECITVGEASSRLIEFPLRECRLKKPDCRSQKAEGRSVSVATRRQFEQPDFRRQSAVAKGRRQQ